MSAAPPPEEDGDDADDEASDDEYSLQTLATLASDLVYSSDESEWQEIHEEDLVGEVIYLDEEGATEDETDEEVE